MSPAWKHRLQRWIALGLTAAAPACGPMLFKGGSPRADIVIESGAPADVQTAASEIVSYGARTTGGAMRVRTAGEASPGISAGGRPSPAIRASMTITATSSCSLRGRSSGF